MKRKIIFRAKRIPSGKWTYFTMYHTPQHDPCTVCQYIGQTDRDGTKIFEGDIVEFDPEDSPFNDPISKDVIFWNEYNCQFDAVRFSVCINKETCSRMKVIGNIHDNPEMI